MNNSKINIINTLKEGILLFSASITQLEKFVFPWLIAAVIFEYFSESTKTFILRDTLIIGGVLTNTLATISSIKIFLSQIRKQEYGLLKTSIMAFIFFIIANEYISFAATIGVLLFILPALLIYASAAFTPIFILDKHYSPFEGLDKSIDATKGNVWRICGLLLIIFIISSAISSITNLASINNQPVVDILNAFTNLISLCLGLISTATITILYEKLHSRVELNYDEGS